ncbi:hypothetical protein PR048_002889 [Dryococelus australis]|uniref:Uncharacterized protein n=1 Tax=Dryococelus australis TaxID=614101 RepID=A0ABQ9ILH3_9NEOP|nr:hypothetical protein PR048_002889 [Dryococelus australis]
MPSGERETRNALTHATTLDGRQALTNSLPSVRAGEGWIARQGRNYFLHDTSAGVALVRLVVTLPYLFTSAAARRAGVAGLITHICSAAVLVLESCRTKNFDKPATVTERLARSPPTMANRVQSPTGWESSRTVPLVDGFSRGSPVSPSPSSRRRSIFTSITLFGSQDLAVKSRPNLFTHSIDPLKNDLYRKAGKYNAFVVAYRGAGWSQLRLISGETRAGSPWQAHVGAVRLRRGGARRTTVVAGNGRRQEGAAGAGEEGPGQPQPAGAPECKGEGETGDPRENPPTSSIVRHHSHLRESGVTRQGIEPGSPWREASSLTAQTPRPLCTQCSNKEDGAPPPGILASVKVPGYLELFSAFETEKRKIDKGDSATSINAGMKGRGKRESPEKTRRPAAMSCTIPRATPPGIEPGSPRWEASSLTTTPPWCLLDSTALCAHLSMSTVHWSAVTVEGDDWASVFQGGIKHRVDQRLMLYINKHVLNSNLFPEMKPRILQVSIYGIEQQVRWLVSPDLLPRLSKQRNVCPDR